MKLNNKDILRQSSRSLRDSFGEEFIKDASARACNLLASTREFESADTILFYYPNKNELSTLSLFDVAKQNNKKIAFPVCDKENNTLTFKFVDSLDDLEIASFGIFEPKNHCKAIESTKNTLCIVPALLFSQKGHRLGYGKGYYDKFLEKFEGISVGFSYSKLLVDSLPSEKHDVPLNIIITESEVHYIA